MPSSTSNFDNRIPPNSTISGTILTGILFVIVVLAAELFFRGLDYLPGVIDNQILWSWHRDRVYNSLGKKGIVLVGASRSQAGIVPLVLKKEFPEYRVIQLAIGGGADEYYDILCDLCADKEFNGIIICDASTRFLMANRDKRNNKYTQFYREKYGRCDIIDQASNSLILSWLQNHLIIFSPRFSLVGILKNLAEGKGPEHLYYHMRFDRSRLLQFRQRKTVEELADFRQKALKGFKESIAGNDPVTPEGFEMMLINEIEVYYDQLRSRGGDLIMVRMPSTGGVWKIEDNFMPKTKYWDRIEPLTRIKTIHFLDYPQLSKYSCPDLSHLDEIDAPEFTRSLSVIIKQKLEENEI